MAEPATTVGAVGAAASLTGSLVILLGPVIGPWAAVLLASLIGSLWTISNVETSSRLTSLMLLARIVLTALVVTGIVAALVADYVRAYLPHEHLLPAVAFSIGALGDKLKELKDSAATRLRGLLNQGTTQ